MIEFVIYYAHIAVMLCCLGVAIISIFNMIELIKLGRDIKKRNKEINLEDDL